MFEVSGFFFFWIKLFFPPELVCVYLQQNKKKGEGFLLRQVASCLLLAENILPDGVSHLYFAIMSESFLVSFCHQLVSAALYMRPHT
jgi:hypothetical protein